jgi:hypothetical protein
MGHSLSPHKPQQTRLYTGKLLPVETRFSGLEIWSKTFASKEKVPVFHLSKKAVNPNYFCYQQYKKS